MSIDESNSTSTDAYSIENKWDKAIVDAEAELATIERKRMRLRQAIRIFKENRRAGVQWPVAAQNG